MAILIRSEFRIGALYIVCRISKASVQCGPMGIGDNVPAVERPEHADDLSFDWSGVELKLRMPGNLSPLLLIVL